MTAEIAILNDGAVVLAADTMTTLSEGARCTQRTGHQKIFALHDSEPVAIMINGRDDGLSAFLIPQFKKDHAGRRHRTIEAWTAEFKTFLEGATCASPCERAQSVAEYTTSLALEVEMRADEVLRRYARVRPNQREGLPGPPSADDFKVAMMLLQLDIDDEVHALSKKQVDGIIAYDSGRAVKGALGAHWLCDRGLKARFMRLLRARLASTTPTAEHAEVVIAGYGTDEFQPMITATAFDGHLGDVFKAIAVPLADDLPAIMPFAQRDMPDAFLSGIDDNLLGELRDLQMVVGIETLVKLADEMGLTLPQARIVKAASGAYLDFASRLAEIRRSTYREPIDAAVSGMAPDDLGSFARSLVESTISRHRYRFPRASVGGGVDVAIISRQRGGVHLDLCDRATRDIRAA